MADGLGDLVVRLIGDGSSYAKMLEHAASRTRKAADDVVGRTQKTVEVVSRLTRQGVQTFIMETDVSEKIDAMGNRVITTAKKTVDAVGNIISQSSSTTIAEVDRAGDAIKAQAVAIGAALSAVFIQLGSESLKAFSAFNKEMNEAYAKMGGQPKPVQQQMESAVLKYSLSGETSFNPTELAKGFENIASAGLSAEESLRALPIVAKFAQSGMFDLETAMKGLLGTVTSMGQRTDNVDDFMHALERASDVAVTIANKTLANNRQMAEAFAGDGGTAAKEYGMTIETLGAIIGAYAEKTKFGAEAANLTGRAIRLLTATFRRHQKAWLSEGIDIIDKTTGEYKNFIVIIKMIEDKMKGMTGPEQGDFLTRIGLGKKTLSLKAITPLIGMADRMKELETASEGTGQSTQQAKLQMESFSNQLKLAGNAATVSSIKIGESLAPAYLMVKQAFGSVIQAWAQAPEIVHTLTIAVGGSVIAFTTLATVIAPLKAAWPLIAMGVKAVWAVMVQLTVATYGFIKAAALATLSGIASGFRNIGLAIAAASTSMKGLAANTALVAASTALLVVALGSVLIASQQATGALQQQLDRATELEKQRLGNKDQDLDKTIKESQQLPLDQRRDVIEKEYDKAIEAQKSLKERLQKIKEDEGFLDFGGPSIKFNNNLKETELGLEQVEKAVKKLKAEMEKLGKVNPLTGGRTFDTKDFEEKLRKEYKLMGLNEDEKIVQEFKDSGADDAALWEVNTLIAAKAAKQFSQELDKEIEALKYSSIEIKKNALLKAGLNDPKTAAANQALMELFDIDAKVAERDIAKVDQELRRLTKSYEKQAEVVGFKNKREAELFGLMDKGTSKEFNKASAAERKLAEAERIQKIFEEADKTKESIRTKDEKFADQVAKLDEQLSIGALTQTEYALAVEKTRNELYKMREEMIKIEGVSLRSGDAIARIQQARDALAARGSGITINENKEEKANGLLKGIYDVLKQQLNKMGAGKILDLVEAELDA